MKTRMVEQREGEFLGKIPESYDFSDSGMEPKWAASCAARFKEIKVGDMVTTDGGWPRFGWEEVMLIGMYDGWPYWQPRPAVCVLGTLGLEWYWWDSISGHEKSSRP